MIFIDVRLHKAGDPLQEPLDRQVRVSEPLRWYPASQLNDTFEPKLGIVSSLMSRPRGGATSFSQAIANTKHRQQTTGNLVAIYLYQKTVFA